MSIEARKISLAQQLFAVDNEFILDKLEAVLTDEPPVISKELKRALEQGLRSLDKDGGIPHEEVMAATRNKFPNLFKK